MLEQSGVLFTFQPPQTQGQEPDAPTVVAQLQLEPIQLDPIPYTLTPTPDPLTPQLIPPVLVQQPISQLTTHNPPPTTHNRKRFLGIAFIILAGFGMSIPILPKARLESRYQAQKREDEAAKKAQTERPLPPSVPLSFNPLVAPDGTRIEPINTEFSIVIPKVGINSAVIAGVDPLNSKDYTQALAKGVAHAKTSYFPDQEGAVYLFSHSTNYEWFVKDLNAIFYNVKDLETGDYIVVFYKGKRYTYKYVNRSVVSPKDTTYLLPVTGKRMLILQTCWPPGSVAERLLIFADLVEERGEQI